ncbi:glycerol dehydrogenase [Salinisphaera sp.]|uniref:glycerol dehydrogenase n=1 Tax=Salinisphaera sp. TaxID=1914330 RepID=UPI002D790562|nr:glycerol dehydrogenase [Salinisphaera sp.]HET7312987.1 glycerol dehydrogenase [Salinisphaera sp.]
MITSAIFPARYIQGADALGELAKHANILGSNALIVLDPGIAEWMRPRLDTILGNELVHAFFDFGGESTEAEMQRAAGLLVEAGHDVVIGVGGGKAIDTAKGAAYFTPGVRMIAVPTIAASDAPCSKNAVVYTPEHTVDRDIHGRANPDLVLVDTAVVAAAPARYLSAGIADALATWLEAESAFVTRTINFTGYASTFTAHAVARLCYDTLLEYAPLALAHCDDGLVTPALEHVVEAATLMSTIGFESGGLGAAHGFHQGIAEWPETHHLLHGEKVAFGVLASLFLTDKDSATVETIYAFCHSVRLPLTLADLGLEHYDDAKLMVAVERMTRSGECTFNEPIAYGEADYLAAMKAADAYGRAWRARQPSANR